MPNKYYYPRGELLSVEYIEDGQIHRNDGPAIVIYHKNGEIHYEAYFYKNKRHRSDGPAFQSWDENGKNLIKEYWENGYLHHTTGPAAIHRDDKGEILCVEYWEKGKLKNREGWNFYFNVHFDDPNDIHCNRRTRLIRSLYIISNQILDVSADSLHQFEHYFKDISKSEFFAKDVQNICWKALGIIRERKNQLREGHGVDIKEGIINKIPEKISTDSTLAEVSKTLCTDKLGFRAGFTLADLITVLDSFWISSEKKINNPASVFNTVDPIYIDMPLLKAKFRQCNIYQGIGGYHAIVTATSDKTFRLHLAAKEKSIWLYILQCYLRLVIADVVCPRKGIFVPHKDTERKTPAPGEQELPSLAKGDTPPKRARIEHYPKTTSTKQKKGSSKSIKSQSYTDKAKNIVLITGRYRKHFDNPEYIPGPQVIENAAREGMLPIPIGYTFVRTHYRGDKTKYNPEQTTYITPLCEMMEITLKKIIDTGKVE